jgi:hypothetical protein
VSPNDPPDAPPVTPEDAAERQAADRQRSASLRVEQERRQLLADWLAAGGTEEAFHEAWPAIQAQLGQMRLQQLGERARNRSLLRFRHHS